MAQHMVILNFTCHKSYIQLNLNANKSQKKNYLHYNNIQIQYIKIKYNKTMKDKSIITFKNLIFKVHKTLSRFVSI